MTRRPKATLGRLLAFGAAATLLTAGCSSAVGAGNAPDGAQTLREGPLNPAEGGAPVAGGELKFGVLTEPNSLDPAATIAALTTGGLEMINIYDTLLRFDAAANSFVPQMAEDIRPDGDERVWTLRLRDGVQFSDGTPLDAAAVKASQERYIEKKGPESALWKDSVVQISTPDPKTVVYELNKTWSDFPGLLTSGPGMIVAPASANADGPFTPVGAGPFAFEKWQGKEYVLLRANPGYWAGAPHLDALRVLYMPSEDVALETMAAGGLDATFVRDPDQTARVVATEPSGFVNMTAAQNAAIVNAAEGRPGHDVRVRRAMQLAVDPLLMTDRAYGTDDGSSTIFPEYSRWHTDTQGLQYDPEEARRLLDEAKADGYDGKLRYTEASDPGSQKAALAFESLLESVGFDVEVELLASVSDQIRTVIVERDYDVAGWGLSYREADPFPKMFSTMHSRGSQTYNMHTSPAMDTLIEDFQLASATEDKLQIMDQIQRQVNEDAPYLVFGPFAEIVVWEPGLHGVTSTSNSMLLFGGAWKE